MTLVTVWTDWRKEVAGQPEHHLYHRCGLDLPGWNCFCLCAPQTFVCIVLPKHSYSHIFYLFSCLSLLNYMLLASS